MEVEYIDEDEMTEHARKTLEIEKDWEAPLRRAVRPSGRTSQRPWL